MRLTPLRILLRPKASNDIDEQFWYLEGEASIETALRFEGAVRQTLETLATHPGMGKGITNALVPDLRRFPVTNFRKILIFYRYDDTSLYVLRVLHGMRDLDNLLDSFEDVED